MSKTLFLESVAGIAGDMFAASFVDAGLVSIEELQSLPSLLNLAGVEIEASHAIKATMKAARIVVKWNDETWKKAFDKHHSHGHEHSHDHSHEHTHEHSQEHGHHSHHHHDDSTNLLLGEDAHTHWHTHYVDIKRLIADSKLDQQTKQLALDIFHLIAEAESAAHGMSIEDVAFHEVGTIDSILDVVMAAYCVGRIGPARVFASPVKVGRGVVRMQHGTHPVPPPASARLLIGMPVAQTPNEITRTDVELSTPTGIAILKALSPQFVNEMPSGVVISQGMGAGSMDLNSYPNVFRVTLLEASTAPEPLPYIRDAVIEIVCNIDDDTAEHISWLAEMLLRKGALDVWTTTVTGKKGRAGCCLSALARIEDGSVLADFLLRHSTTFGVRMREWDRLKLARRFEKRETPRGEVTYKIGMTTSGEVLKEKPEFEDMRSVWETDGAKR
jgi:pyridinium-3,5-bisthiocarboxylic acid mononucleotide nickel chelatase